MPTLLLLRHAKSSWPPGVPDPLRPLNERGRRDAPAAGRILAERSPIDLALVSPAARTGQTYDLVAEQLPARPPTRSDERIYEAGVGDLLEVIAETDDSVGRLLLVGHNSAIEMLAWHLCAPDGSAGYEEMVRKYPTAGLAEIDLPVPWHELPAAVAWPSGAPIGRLVSFVVCRGT
ncbi:MAG: phosphohistidine phosphatase [Actinomycetota bacterium]|nr:phosphohistidine phosphatase [Actinomycetota bacterium]